MNDPSKFKLEKLKNIILQFKIPLAFDVLSSFKQEDAGPPYIVVIDNVPVRVHFERIYDFKFKNEFQIAAFSKMSEDRNSNLSYMRVQVWFDNQTFDSGIIDKDSILMGAPLFFDLAIKYLNKFIKNYKSVTDEFWLRPIIRKDIFNYLYLLVDWDGNHQPMYNPIPSHHMIEFNGNKEFKLSDSQESYLRNSLVSDHYDVRNELLLDMQNNFSLGYYNIALLQSITAFENYVYSQLKKTLSKTKLNKLKKKESCGCLVGISEVCSRGIMDYYRVDFGITEEFENLKTCALKYRNLIVHGEILEQIDLEVCKRGMEAVKAAENFLSVNVFSNTQNA